MLSVIYPISRRIPIDSISAGPLQNEMVEEVEMGGVENFYFSTYAPPRSLSRCLDADVAVVAVYFVPTLGMFFTHIHTHKHARVNNEHGCVICTGVFCA